MSKPGLDTLNAEIGAGNGVFARLDVTDPAGFSAAMAGFGEATGGTLDLMFSNAGIAVPGMFDEQAWDDVMKVVNVNFLGVMIGIRAAMPLLRATQGSLCLVNASSSAIFGTAGIGVYSATKHAVRGLVEALSIELKRYGVRAADLLPGLVDTPILSAPMRAMAPPDGMWRLVPAAEVAERGLVRLPHRQAALVRAGGIAGLPPPGGGQTRSGARGAHRPGFAAMAAAHQ